MTLRPCLSAGCPTLTTRTYCPTHTVRKPTRTEQGYTNTWLCTSKRILERDNHTCHYCGGYATTTDHIIPKIKGGTDDDGNLVAACRSCNSSKGGR